MFITHRKFGTKKEIRVSQKESPLRSSLILVLRQISGLNVTAEPRNSSFVKNVRQTEDSYDDFVPLCH